MSSTIHIILLCNSEYALNNALKFALPRSVKSRNHPTTASRLKTDHTGGMREGRKEGKKGGRSRERERERERWHLASRVCVIRISWSTRSRRTRGEMDEPVIFRHRCSSQTDYFFSSVMKMGGIQFNQIKLSKRAVDRPLHTQSPLYGLSSLQMGGTPKPPLLRQGWMSPLRMGGPPTPPPGPVVDVASSNGGTPQTPLLPLQGWMSPV